jgi:transcriptional regulator with XRE-family HTH domain
MPAVSEVLAGNIRGERAKRRWRQADLATRLGMAQRTISDIEAGRQLTVPELILLCRVLDVTAADLMRGADPDDLAALGL